MLEASGLFRLLGDDARLRLLRLLTAERLNVSELTAILGIAQSGVSRHLGLLRDAGLLEENREGGFTYYRAPRDEENSRVDSVWPVLRAHFARAASEDVFRDDDARLREVIRLRRENRDTHGAATGGESRQLVPGRSWTAWSRSLSMLLPPLTVADLGCGDGHLTLEMAVWARRVIAVDRSPQVLSRARALARRRGVSNIVWKRGNIEKLPMDDGCVDVAVLSQALHHVREPEGALSEAIRVVTPGGRVLVLDLAEHSQEWVRDRYGDRWLGFSHASLEALMRQAGLTDVVVRTGVDGDPFPVVIAVGTSSSETVTEPRASRRRRRRPTEAGVSRASAGRKKVHDR